MQGLIFFKVCGLFNRDIIGSAWEVMFLGLIFGLVRIVGLLMLDLDPLDFMS